MKRILQASFAAIFGALLVTSAAFGAVMLTNPDVHSMDDAADEFIERGEGQIITIGATVAVAAMGYQVYQENTNDHNADELAEVDANETKTAIYDSASIQNQNNDLLNTAYSNYLNDTETIALMEGKNAYIRALENGSVESVARNRATDAVADYYAVKQKNVIASWNTSVQVGVSAHNTAANTTGVSGGFVSANHGGAPQGTFETNVGSISLVNATSAPVVKMQQGYDDSYQHFNDQFSDGSPQCPCGFTNFTVSAPNENYEKLVFAQTDQIRQKWDEIQSQNTDVQNQLDTFIDGTYDSYNQGDINVTDLVDPYLGAQQYSPENSSEFQDWSLRTLSSLGLSSPENLSNIGRMNVTSGGSAYTGILMSDGNPDGGFTVGETYNASNLSGLQFVARDGGGQTELEGEFTLASAETADGDVIQQNESVTYKNVTYETADTEEFAALQEDLDELQAEINAKQQQERNAGGGGLLPDFGLGGVGVPTGLLVVAGAAVLLLGRN